MTCKDPLNGEFSIIAAYDRIKDTITCISSYSDGSDVEKATYILDQSNRVIKCNYYEANKITEIDSLIYKNEKIIKTIITNPVSGTNAGDSMVYTYDQIGNLKSSKQYGNSGETWAYAEFESDATGRVCSS